MWDELDDSLHRDIGAVDRNLQKYVEFSSAQDQLRSWLTEYEAYMQQISQPAASLPDKINLMQVRYYEK